MSRPQGTHTAATADVDRVARDLKIPPCPAVLAQFIAEARKEEPDTRLMAGLIGSDAGLAAAVVRAVNSPAYGLSRKAADVPQALAILGLRSAVNLITGLMLRRAFPVAAGALMQRYWDESLRIADAAAFVAARTRGSRRDEAHTYALFRNCGMAVMIARFPDYGPFLDAHLEAPGPALLQAEESKYGFHHARVGFALARGWVLPDTLACSILFHHDIERVAARTGETRTADPALVAIGLLAEQIATLNAGGGITAEWSAHETFVLETLAITPDQIVALIQDGGDSTG
jgi:HD-like signal output (HDOD) protein